MDASLVALNIFITEQNTIKLLNKTEIPILFYWNGEDDVKDNFLNNKSFRELVDMSCFNKDTYANSQIGYFMFKLISGDENYEEHFIKVQDLFYLKDLTETENMFYIEYIIDIISSLYKTAMGNEYTGDILSDENDKIIKMYLDIQNKYPKRFVKNTLLNYVRSELIKTYNLHQINTDWIINKLENILKDQN